MRITILFCIIGAACAVSFFDVSKEEWTEFKIKFNKSYSTVAEDNLRFKIYLENRHKIAKHNSNFNQKLVTYEMEINRFADMLTTEVVGSFTGLIPLESNGTSYVAAANVKIPSTVDWRTLGAVTPVVDQGQCGSCWAFAAVSALESQWFRKTGGLTMLSKQQLVDCARERYDNYGCKGGMPDRAYLYIRDNGGIEAERTYAYEGLDNQCRFDRNLAAAKVTGFTNIQPNREDLIMNAVATIGPVTVAISVIDSFQFYSGGIYAETRCSQRDMNHAVVIVGYGTENGVDYWIVKNSWGPGWGDKGYIKMIRNRNVCAISLRPTFPLV